MSPKKIERLIRLLREQGVEYLKTPDIEIRLKDIPSGASGVSTLASPRPDAPVSARQLSADPGPVTGAAIPPIDNGIPHHVNEVAKLLKLSDEDLVDRLFPDYQAGTG